jgi:hypothetical protein
LDSAAVLNSFDESAINRRGCWKATRDAFKSRTVRTRYLIVGSAVAAALVAFHLLGAVAIAMRPSIDGKKFESPAFTMLADDSANLKSDGSVEQSSVEIGLFRTWFRGGVFMSPRLPHTLQQPSDSQSPYWSAWQIDSVRKKTRTIEEHGVGFPGVPLFVLTSTDPPGESIEPLLDRTPVYGFVVMSNFFDSPNVYPYSMRIHWAGTIATVIIAGCTAWFLTIFLPWFRFSRHAELRRCAHCRYPWVDSNDPKRRCPECGHGVSDLSA